MRLQSRIRFTLVRRACYRCGRTVGLGVWRWSGAIYRESDGLCAGCRRRLIAGIEAPGPAGQGGGRWH